MVLEQPRAKCGSVFREALFSMAALIWVPGVLAADEAHRMDATGQVLILTPKTPQNWWLLATKATVYL